MKKYLFLFILFLTVQMIYSQRPFSTKAVAPPSPNVTSLLKFTESPVSMYTGIPEVNIPVFTIKGFNIDLPINLKYHAGGVKVTEAASWVGIGWALNAGGVITQSIRGIRDDSQVGRFNISPFNLNSTDNPAACDVKAIADGRRDSEPDFFNFSLNGKSGQFFLNDAKAVIPMQDQKLKIEMVANGTPPLFTIWSWKITDQDGTQYIFEDVEQAISQSKTVRNGVILGSGEIGNYPQETQRTWMLTRIVLTNTEVIAFNYETYNSLDYMLASETQYFSNGPYSTPATCSSVTLPSDYFNINKNFQMQSTYQGKRLQSIVFPEGRVDFVTGASRCDIYGDKFLDKVIIANSSGQKIKELDLTYKYYVGTTAYTTAALNCSADLAPNVEYDSPTPHNYFKDRRLFLTSVDEVDANNVKIGTYVLDYENSIGLPNRFSAQQDWWGYYNGNGYTSLLQNVYKTNQMLDGLYRYDIHGRNPNLLYAKQGTLKRITYPTGGYTDYEYELNSSQISFGPTYTVHQEVNYTASGQTSGTFLGNITINDISGSTVLPFQVDKCVFGTTTNSFVGFYITDMSNNIVVSGSQVNTALQTASNGEVSFTLNSGQYKIYSYATASFPCTYNIKVKKWTDQPPLPDNKDFGGLRVKKVSSYDPVALKKLIKVYDYTELINGKNLSTGSSSIPFTAVRYDYVIGKSVCLLYAPGGQFPYGEESATFIAVNSSTNYPLSSSQNGTFGYSRVVEKSVDDLGNDLGYSVFQYQQSSDYVGQNYSIILGSGGYSALGADLYPWTPAISQSWQGGKPKKIEHYKKLVNGTYSKIKSETYVYSQVVNSDTTKAFVGAYLLASSFTSGNGCPDGALLTVYDKVRYNQYKLFSGYQLLNSVTTEEADANSNILTSKVEYEYSPTNFLPSKISTTNSLTGKTIQQIKYAKDYPPVTATDAVSDGVKSLQNAFAIGKPIEQTTQRVVNNVNIGTTKAIFNSYKATNLEPDKTFALELTAPITNFATSALLGGAVTKDSRYQERVSVNLFDAKANILEQQMTGDIKAAYLWDYAYSYPICEVNNSAQSDIAYTSFEADSKGNWVFSGVTVPEITAPTGRKAYNLSGGNITKSVLSGTTYVLSYWRPVALSPLTISGTISGSFISGRVVNGWKYYEHKITAVSTATISGTGLLDELRLYPSGAQAKTFTFDPLIGVTSICDVNSNIQYFIYDGLARLIMIKDQDGNILKKYCYNYASQPVSCDVYLNDDKSANFTRTNCGVGYTGGIYYVTIPAGMFSSSVSKADANNKATTYGNAQANLLAPCIASGSASIYCTNYISTSNFQISYYNLITGLTYNFTANYGSNVLMGSIPSGQYNITIVPTVNGIYDYTVSACGYYGFGGTFVFSNILVDNTCNKILVAL